MYLVKSSGLDCITAISSKIFARYLCLSIARATEVSVPEIEYVTNKINNAKANVPEVAGNPRGLKEVPKDWTNMNMSELKDNWDNILKSAEAKLKSKE